MLDGRVLTAVLASVAAIAAGVNGGTVDAGDLKSNSVSAPGDLSFEEIFPGSFQSLSRFTEKPEPENSVRVEVDAGDSSLDFKTRRADIRASNLSEVSYSGKRISSPLEIKLYGFNGKVRPGTESSLKGNSDGIYSNSVNISGGFRISEEFETSVIEVEDNYRSALKFEDVTGTVVSNSSNTRLRGGEDLSINSFSGDMVVYPENSSLILEGKVDELDWGEISLG